MRLYIGGETPQNIANLTGFDLEQELQSYPDVLAVHDASRLPLENADGLIFQFAGPNMAHEHRLEMAYQAGKHVLAMVYHGFGLPHQVLPHLEFPSYGGIASVLRGEQRPVNALRVQDEASGGTVSVVFPYKFPRSAVRMWMWAHYHIEPQEDQARWAKLSAEEFEPDEEL